MKWPEWRTLYDQKFDPRSGYPKDKAAWYAEYKRQCALRSDRHLATRQCQLVDADLEWTMIRRPYFNVWPQIIRPLVSVTLELESTLISMPRNLGAMLIRFPAGQEQATMDRPLSRILATASNGIFRLFMSRSGSDETWQSGFVPTSGWTVEECMSGHMAHSVDVGLLTGDESVADRIAMLERFKSGESRILISRASMLGYGMNFQMCGSMVFSGWNDSYVAWYQAIRRAFRYGQTKRVRVHVPVIEELEGDMLENIFSKQDQNEADIAEMERNYIEAMKRVRGAA